jgi:hypothetical protein
LFSGCWSGVLGDFQLPGWQSVATDSIGTGVDGAGYDVSTSDVFASNADGTLTVIQQDSPDQYRVIQSVETAPASRNMGVGWANPIR